jgi:hypothetical protein
MKMQNDAKRVAEAQARRIDPALARFLLCALCASAVSLSGCGIRPKPPMAGMTASKMVASPFAPKSLELHPLTRVEREGSGKPLILCHIEFRDEWGDTCKATGQLQVQLYRPVGGRQSGLGTQELTWDVDLSDLEMQRLFDSATRTYRLELEGAPDWVMPANGGKNSNANDARGRLRAVLTSAGPQGETRTLSSELMLGD